MAPFTSNYCTRRLQCGAGDRERERKGEEWDGGEGKISAVICI